MVKIKYLIFFILISFSFQNVMCNQFLKSPFDIINTESGLSQNAVISICQDSSGFIWFGTNDGLNKYDGFEFKLLKYQPEEKNTLPNNTINCLLPDKNNSIWVGTANGLCKVNSTTLDTKSFFPKKTNGKLWSVNSLLLSEEEYLFVGSDLGLFKFNINTETFSRIPLIKKSEKFQEPITTLVLDSSNNLFIGTAGLGLFVKNSNDDSIKKINLIRKKIIYIEDYFVYNICKTKDNTIFITTERSCFYIEPNSTKIIENKTLSEVIWKNYAVAMIENDNSLLLGLYQKGIVEYNRKTNKIDIYDKYYPENNFFKTNDIYTLFKDKSGVIWIGTDGTGVLKLNPKKVNFGSYKIEKNGICVMAVEQDSKDTLWVGSYGNGLYKLNINTGIEKHFSTTILDNLKLSDEIIISLLKDSQDNLWIGYMNNGLTIYNLKTKKVTNLKGNIYDYNTIGNNMVTCFYEDSNQNIWIGTGYGISLYLRKKQVFRHIYNNELDKSSLSGNIVTYITERKNGDILAATSGGGINVLDKSGKIRKIFKHDKNNKKTLGYNFVNYIFEDEDETLWISTSGMGFDKKEKNSDHFIHYRESDGLPNNSVFVILEDDDKNLWMSTNKGISKFNIKDKIFTNYDFRDGLQGNEYNSSSGIKLKSGKISFGGIKGLNIFDPKLIKKSQIMPKTVITDVRLFNKPLKKEWKISKNIEIPYNKNTFSFDFICLDYAMPEKNKYKYMMEGIDNETIETTYKNRSVTYAGLAPGKYTFKVWGANGDNIWDLKGDSLKIHIKPPFWGTVSFKIFAILIFIIFSNLLFFGWKKLYISYQYWRSSHIIGKRYKIIEKIGAGGTGAVFKANDKTSGGIVALKILDEKYIDEETSKRFSVEQSVYEKIKHKNTVEIFSKGEHNGKLYYVMEFVEGITLSQFIKINTLNENQILCIFDTILDIVHEIHIQGVIHRDIKPDNIMICNNLDGKSLPLDCSSIKSKEIFRDNLKILDFGLAKILGSKTLTQSAIFGGTLYYFPPEFLFGRKIRETAFDFYSLGVVLYEMLTKSHLYDVKESAELLAAVVSGTPSSPKEKNSNISIGVSDFVMNLIAKDPENRLKDYESIKTALSKALK